MKLNEFSEADSVNMTEPLSKTKGNGLTNSKEHDKMLAILFPVKRQRARTLKIKQRKEKKDP
jgi:hypothetical protein